MKKILMLSLFSSLSLNLYLVSYESVVLNDFSDGPSSFEQAIKHDNSRARFDKVQFAQAAISRSDSKEHLKQLSSKESCSCLHEKKIVQKEIEINSDKQNKKDKVTNIEYTEDYIRDQIENKKKEWLEKSENFFVDELGISTEQIDQYRKLAEQRQKQIDMYFTKKHQNVAEDELTSYVFTTQDTIFMGKLAQEYEDHLKELFGEDNYHKHKQFIHKHNSKLNNQEFVQYIEF